MTLRWCFAFIIGSLVFSVPAQGQLRVTVDREHVVVRDVAAGDQVAIIGVAQEFPGDTMHVRAPFSIAEDDDRDGEVSHRDAEILGSEGLRAGFVAVELSSGRRAIGMSEGTRPEVGPNPRILVSEGRDPKPVAVAIRARLVSALLVRPGVGAWRKIIQDGARSDGDGRGDGTILISPAGFARATDDSQPPTEYLDGDIVVAINMHSREINVVDIEGPRSKILGETD